MKRNQSKAIRRVLAFILSILIVVATVPFVAAEQPTANRKVDPSTMDGWKDYFGPDVETTQNAGAVWMDKSVFTDASEFPESVRMKDDENNFLVALSAIAANKEIVGYSTIPTDTMLVLDISGSMANDAATLVSSANAAIKKLLDTNYNNRVGVVVYAGNTSSGASTYEQGTKLLLPLSRYTANNNVYLRLDGGTVKVASSLRDQNNKSYDGSKSVAGGTYIQAGIYEALKQFEKAYENNDTVVKDNFQDGTKRLPIMVLMSDGAPTTSTTNFAEVDKKYYIGSGKDRQETDQSISGNGTYSTAEIAFLTQLTASYALSKMEEYYDRTGEGLFYTLGLTKNLSAEQAPFALAVLDPEGSPNEDVTDYWKTYLELKSNAALSMNVPPTSGSNYKSVSIYKNSYAVNPIYVDRYFKADSSKALTDAFEDIVEQIIIQSRYYPTNLEGGNPDFSGYITFEDKIGEYMEVKDIKGILAHNTHFTGAMLTSKITSGADGLGTPENPTELGLEFINAVKTRLGITNSADAFELVKMAWDAKQLYYKSDTDFSNYIGWYASADGRYLGFYNEGTTTAPEGAVYANKSYGLLGTSGSSIAPSDMMFMSIQVHTNIATKEQTLIWKIPAALVPLVTYKITLEGKAIETATNVEVNYEAAQPIRLLFETGLRSKINELNVGQIIDAKHIAADGITRQFYSNYFDKSAPEHEDHVATMVGFIPSVQNERYYYTQDSTVYVFNASNDSYEEVTGQNHNFAGKYYHARWIFDKNKDSAIPYYEEISADSLSKRKYDAQKDEWYIPLGTVYQFYDNYIIPKTSNITDSIIFSINPFVTRTNASYEVDAKLGNNGILYVTPATGIRLSKTVDVLSPGASDSFKFKITLSAPAGQVLKEKYPAVIANLNEYEGTNTELEVKNNVIELEIKKDQTVYITGLPANTTYVIQELETNPAYKVKDVHINGVLQQGDEAAGIIGEAMLSDVEFVNTPISEGNLVISKRVTHPFGESYRVNDSIEFNVRVELTNPSQSMANKELTIVKAAGRQKLTTDNNGAVTFKITNSETVSIEGIPERTAYKITETDLPDGFRLDTASSTALDGRIDASNNAAAVLVNDYTPAGVDANITVDVSKTLTGRTWLDRDVFEFVVESIDPLTRETTRVIDTVRITKNGAKTVSVSLSGESYAKTGTYYYRIIEKAGNIGGITYDTAERRFDVYVTDTDMDGRLEVSRVENLLHTTVTGDATNGYKVSADFENSYRATAGSEIIITVNKRIENDNFQLNGFRFALYDENGEYIVNESTVTDVNGNARIDLVYAAVDAGKTFKYLLKEINTGIGGMIYDTKEYPVTVEIVDNLDGTTKAVTTVSGIPQGEQNPVFVNHYDPTDATVIFSATKSLTGRVLNASEFTFNLYKLNGPNDTIVGKSPIKTAKNEADSSILFDAVTLDTAGEYYFAVAEQKGTLGGITYDDRVYVVKVTVTDNGGVLTAHADFPQGGIVFENKYTTTNTSVELKGIKTLTGRDIRDNEFTFAVEGDGITRKEVKNEGATFTFGEITFTKAGVYTYTVSEVKGSEKGITYDESVYTVTYTVTDNGRGNLVVTDTRIHKNGLDATSIVFANAYVAAPVDMRIEGTKVLDGRQLKADDFEFTLIGSFTGTEYETVTNDANGVFKFSPRTATSVGTYRFRVVEKHTAKGGISYDSSIFVVVFTVKDDLYGNLYVESTEYFKNDVAVNGIVFNNSYKAAPVYIDIAGTKKLDGRQLEGDEFTFELYKKGESTPVKTVKNAKDGSFVFEDIGFDKAGTYEYTVKELKGEKYGITYDQNAYNVKVEVKDDLLGRLYAEVTTTLATGSAEIVFNNKFDAEDVKVVITVNKTVDNKTVQNIGLDGFEFVLTDKDSKEVKRVVTDSQGKATIELTYDKESVGKQLSYKLAEIKGEKEGMKYSEKVYDYVISIDYDSDYRLVAKVTKDGKTDDALTAEFVNVYEGVKNEEPPIKTDTGDDFNVNVWLAVLFVSGGIVPFAFGKKKKD